MGDLEISSPAELSVLADSYGTPGHETIVFRDQRVHDIGQMIRIARYEEALDALKKAQEDYTTFVRQHCIDKKVRSNVANNKTKLQRLINELAAVLETVN